MGILDLGDCLHLSADELSEQGSRLVQHRHRDSGVLCYVHHPRHHRLRHSLQGVAELVLYGGSSFIYFQTSTCQIGLTKSLITETNSTVAYVKKSTFQETQKSAWSL